MGCHKISLEQAHVDMNAGPAVPFRALDHGSANRIEFDVVVDRHRVAFAFHQAAENGVRFTSLTQRDGEGLHGSMRFGD